MPLAESSDAERIRLISAIGAGPRTELGAVSSLDVVPPRMSSNPTEMELVVAAGEYRGAQEGGAEELAGVVARVTDLMSTLGTTTLRMASSSDHTANYRRTQVDAVYGTGRLRRTRPRIQRVSLLTRDGEFLETPPPIDEGGRHLTAWAAAQPNVLDYRRPAVAGHASMVAALNDREALLEGLVGGIRALGSALSSAVVHPDPNTAGLN